MMKFIKHRGNKNIILLAFDIMLGKENNLEN
jgi:hypothetical protein